MRNNLDSIRDDLIVWADSLWNEEAGAFPNVAGEPPTLEGSTFMAYILSSMDALDDVHCDRGRWTAWMQSQQSEKDGSFAFPPPIGSDSPRRGIALWNAVRALNILGGEVLRFPAYLKAAMTVDGLRDWFETWKAWGDPHHEVLSLVPTLVSHPDPAWVEAFFDELADQQHPTQGIWPRGDKPANISRVFAYSLIYLGMGRVPPQPGKIVDAILDLQGDDGFWHGRPGFSTMDAVFLLARLPRKIGWRESDAQEVLGRVLDVLIPYYEQNSERDRSDVHQFAATVQTLALLFEALPDRFETSHTWSFSWDKCENWQCPVIAKELG